jgi:hypothetical protein
MGPVLALVAFVILLFGVGSIYLFGAGQKLYYRCVCVQERERERERERLFCNRMRKRESVFTTGLILHALSLLTHT